jgi:hypothetical protein
VKTTPVSPVPDRNGGLPLQLLINKYGGHWPPFSSNLPLCRTTQHGDGTPHHSAGSE